MAEEKKAAPKQKKKAAASKKEAPKTVAKKTATKAEQKAQDKNILSVGDVVQASVFTGIRGAAKIISTDNNITTVEFEGKSYTTKTRNVRKIKE